MPATRPASPRRALWLLAILSVSALAPLVSAQTDATPATPLICFPGKDTNPQGTCSGRDAAHYLQLQPVTISFRSATELDVSVRCVRGCPVGDPSATNVYWATFRGPALVFPTDFREPGPDLDGADALADRAGRYNSTWEVAIDGLPGVSRQFHVWLYDAFLGKNLTVHPGETHTVRAAGFTPGAEVTYRWEKRDPTSGQYSVISSLVRRASTTGETGLFLASFQLPPSEAANITLCGKATLDCYRLSVSGAGKQAEVVPVQVGVADIERSIDTTERPAPSPAGDVAHQRSDNISFAVDLYYPGGTLRHGPKLQPGDLHPLPNAGNALRVAVEKTYRTNASTFLIGEAALTFRPEEFLWRAQWTAPKNMTLEPNVFYQLRIVEQFDRYGNRVVSDVLGTFTLASAQLDPAIAEGFTELERTELGTMRLAVRYHDGTPFTPDDAVVAGNQSPLRGCFVPIPPPATPGAPRPTVNACSPGDNLTWGQYDATAGLWNFSTRYARDYPRLDAHRFVLVNGTQDRYGNTIFGEGSPTYVVTPAQPRIAFSTVARGSETEVLERGNDVFVSATITYHDGSPYNRAVRVDPASLESQTLAVRLLRRGPAESGYGPLAGEEIVNLTETDSSVGRWSGHLHLARDDSNAPAGIWTFEFNVADNVTVPNANVTSFDREVVSSTIVVCPTVQPPASAPTGTVVKFRFRLYYSACDTGTEVPEAAVVGKLSARVFRYDPARLVTTGEAVSNVLVPSFSRAETLDWGLEYTIPDGLYSGSFVLNLTGADTFGNRVVPGSLSRSFTTFTEVIVRDVVAQPPTSVERGESATVVFDAREGDTSVDPNRPAPRIQLERFDTSSSECDEALAEGGCWVRERLDVRALDATFEDHVGIFPVGVETPVGLYRFSLQGRDARFRIITSVSENFSVEPTLVARAFLAPPPERIVKGEPFTFYLEQMPGDQVKDKLVFLDGRPIAIANPLVTNEYGRVNVTWAIPFDAPNGNYTVRVSGRDAYGNDIVVLTPPIEGMSAELDGRLLGQPPRVVERNSVARILFAVTYPDGAFYAASDTPRVNVRNATGIVASATLRREGLTFAADWTPPADTPLGDYYFEVSSQPTGGTGNAFPPLRSNAFKVVPGRIVRPAVDDMMVSFERLTSASYSVGFEPDDKFVNFELVYYGPSLSTVVDQNAPLPEITRSPLAHTIDPAGGKYVARIVTDQQSQTGTFRVQMTGEDGHGNRIVSTSRQFVIQPTTIGIQFDGFPKQSDFGEGKTVTISFVTKYAIGTLMDDSYGRPTAVVLYNNRPVTQRPELEYLDGHWYMTWTAPEILPDGTYIFTMGGYDIHGNPIATSRSTPYTVSSDVTESFAKTIPGPSPAIALVCLVALAALVRRFRARAP